MKRMAMMAAALLMAGCGDDSALVGRGWVEGREVDIAPLTGGRLVSVRVDEGDTVAIGDTIALLSGESATAEAGVAAARADAASARVRELERGARPEDVAAARATLNGAEAELARASRELARIESLDSLDFLADQIVDDARATVLSAAARRDVAREALTRLRVGATAEERSAARAELAAAQAAQEGARSMADELVLVSPASGPVIVRVFDAGEVVVAGAPVATVLAGDERWVRIWLPQRALRPVRPGTRARIIADGMPDTTFEATVVSIATRAEFTPRVALTDDERADLMYAVRLDVIDPGGYLRVGLPVQARFGEAAE